MNENMEFSTLLMKEEFEELLEDKPDLVEIQEIKMLKEDDSSNDFKNNSFCSANVKFELKKDDEDNCICPGNQFHVNETIGEKEENVTAANIMESSTFSVKEEFEELPEDKPDLVEIQEIKMLKEDDSPNDFMNNSFHSADVKSELKKDDEDDHISPANQFHTNETISENEENIWNAKDDETHEIISKHNKKCEFCLRTTNATVLFNEMDRQMLDILLTNFEVKENAPSVICNDCSNMLQEVFAFKSSCLYTEDSLIPFIDSQNLGTLDISTVFHEIHKDQRSLLPKNANICRFCLEILEKVSFTYLKDLSEANLEMMKKVVPDMQLEATKEPVICEKCLYCLKISFKFINDCLNALKQCHNSSSISLNDNLNPILFSQNEIKSEENNLILSEADSENSRNPDDGTVDPKATKRKCEEKDQETRKYKCDKCPFETKFRKNLGRHIRLMHEEREPSLVNTQMYKCNKCSFQTKYKNNLKQHSLMHKKPEELEMHKCDICPFQTKYSWVLRKHSLVHKKPEELQMHKCDICPFQTKYRWVLRNHICRLHGEMNTQVYKCDKCSFQTKYKESMKKHRVIHDQVQFYKCDKCLYQTIHKEYLKTHDKLMHKKPEELKMHKCDKCPFQTKLRKNLGGHIRRMHGER